MLFNGTEGVGKRLIARELARSSFCDRGEWQGCGACSGCRGFDSGNCPDFHLLDLELNHDASVERGRELIHTLQMKSFSGKKRVVVIDNAQSMTPSFGNLLLKTLEEPRPDTHFIIITSSTSRLLKTLVSRCQSLFFESLSIQEMQQIVAAQPELLGGALQPEKAANAILWSDGSCAGLSRLSTHVELADSILHSIRAILGGNGGESLNLAQMLSKNKDQSEENCKLLLAILRAAMHITDDARSRTLLSFAVHNCVAAIRLMGERHLSPQYLITCVLTQLLPGGEREERVLLDSVVI